MLIFAVILNFSPVDSSGRERRLISSQQYGYSQYSNVSLVVSALRYLAINKLSDQIGENEDMFDLLVGLGQFGGHTDDGAGTNFVTVSDEDTIDISHVSLSTSCRQKQVSDTPDDFPPSVLGNLFYV